MKRYRLHTVIKGYLTSVFLKLEGLEIGLAYDGNQTYVSTDELDIDEALNIVLHCRGVAFSAWSIQITLDNRDEPLYSRSGHIDLSNESIVKEAVLVADGEVGSDDSGDSE